MSTLRRDVALASLTARTRFVVLDVETTPSETGDRVVSVGAVQVDGRGQRRAEPIEWLCQPGVPVENTRVHGLTDTDLLGHPTLAARLDDLADLLTASHGERVVLVAHHAPFDVGVLLLEHARAGRMLPDVTVLDTRAVARHLGVAAGGFRLGQLLTHYGLSLTHHHNALADATDTARLLGRLLVDAALAGHVDLDALLEQAQPGRVTALAYPARAGVRTIRVAADSPFTFIERSTAHQATHAKLPRQPSTAQLGVWLDGLRDCVRLRCPLLPDKADRLLDERPTVVRALLADYQTHVAAGRTVDANTTLTALLPIIRLAVPGKDAPAFHDRWAATLDATTRCVDATGTPIDACPDCRAGRACPADVWHHTLAEVLVTRNMNSRAAGPWLRGRLVDHAAAGRTRTTSHAAWLIFRHLNGDAGRTASLLDTVRAHDLLEPRIAHHQVTELATRDIDAALAFAEATLLHRDGSTDPAWTDLAATRDALAARQSAASRVRPARPHRAGHSATSRPSRRRFTA